jgi:aryl-alcohol dehydrogenase-like predicted oxidoreductase
MNIDLPKACLGTMNFGSITDDKTSFKIMDTAIEMGCNFFDTAEMYSVPCRKETDGLSEKIIGRWMKERKNRNDIFLASKVVGPEKGNAPWIREGEACFDKKNIRKAIIGSLERLQTDYLDLYQLHWPNRKVNIFGVRNFPYPIHPEKNPQEIPLEETLAVLQDLQKEGLVKHFGLSNETPWGVSECLRLEREKNLPKMVSIQNNYSLLTRTFETALSEFTYQENIGLLAYSPLAFGALVDTKRVDGRFDTYADIGIRYRAEKVQKIIEKYRALARKHDMTLPQLAIRFIASQPFVQSIIIGPATVEQTRDGIISCGKTLAPEILQAIETIHEEHPNVCPQ